MSDTAIFYRYVKPEARKATWKAVAETEPLGDRDYFTTILVVDKKAKSTKQGGSVEGAKYKGPFYVDIDETPAKAIKLARQAIKKLTDAGVNAEDIRVWASGKKGFHITVPQAVFTDDRGYENLPKIYKAIAIALKLEADMTVYSQGRGRMWRVPGLLRGDNQRYKVPITIDELQDMKVADYDTLVEQARDEFPEPTNVKRVDFLSALFKRSSSKVTRMLTESRGVFIDPELKRAIRDNEDYEDSETQLPPCAVELMHGEVAPNTGFNDVSLQFAKAVAAFAPGNSLALIDEFAENAKGESYNTQLARRNHCTTAFHIASRDVGYDWSCRSILSVLKSEPCERCPIAHIRYAHEKVEETGQKSYQIGDDIDLDNIPVYKPRSKANGSLNGHAQHDHEVSPDSGEFSRAVGDIIVAARADEPGPSNAFQQYEVAPSKSEPLPPETDAEYDFDQGNLEGLMMLDRGFAFMDAKGQPRMISNFTMRLSKYYMEYIPNLDADRRTASMAEVFINGKLVGSTLIEEPDWQSKNSFLKCLAGLGNAGFTGKDDDVQRMKIVLMDKLEMSAEKIRKVYSAGIHRDKIAGKHVFTWVEPGWSIDNFGSEDKYFLAAKVGFSVQLKNVREPSESDLVEIQGILRALLQTNEPSAVARMFGWTMACFLKQHIIAFKKEFPLLGVHGNRGSGKSKGFELMVSALHGAEYWGPTAAINGPNATEFVIWASIASTTTIPVILDEYNKGKFKFGRYESTGEVLKDVWQAGTVKRGGLTKNIGFGRGEMGTEVRDIQLTGPVAILSEQGITMPALVQRTVQVSVSPRTLSENDGRARRAFNRATGHWELMKKFSKVAYMTAVHTSVEDVKSWLEQANTQVDMELGDRPHHAFSTVILGLTFFGKVCEELGIDMTAEIAQLHEDLQGYLREQHAQIVEDKSRSEIDIIISKMAAMAALSQDVGANSSRSWLVCDQHYKATEQYLYLDLVSVFYLFQQYSGVIREPSVITELTTFKELLSQEPYAVDMMAYVDGFANGRPAVQLSRAEMTKRGLDTSPFMTTEF